MNLNSEIEFYSELRVVDKARLLNLFLHELAEEARATYGPGAEQVHDGAHLRFVQRLRPRHPGVRELRHDGADGLVRGETGDRQRRPAPNAEPRPLRPGNSNECRNRVAARAPRYYRRPFGNCR